MVEHSDKTLAQIVTVQSAELAALRAERDDLRLFQSWADPELAALRARVAELEKQERRLRDALSVIVYSIRNPNCGRADLIKTADEWHALAGRPVKITPTEYEREFAAGVAELIGLSAGTGET